MSNIVDFSFVYEMSENDGEYIHDVCNLFLKTVSEGLVKLEDMIRTEDDLDLIRRQAHFLKSSANVIKVKGMFDDLYKLETMAREQESKDKMKPIIENLVELFRLARPEIEAEVEKNKPKAKA